MPRCVSLNVRRAEQRRLADPGEAPAAAPASFQGDNKFGVLLS